VGISTGNLAAPAAEEHVLSGRRLAGGYAVVIAFLATATAVSISIGHDENPPAAVGAFWHAPAASCFGDNFELRQSGKYVDLHGKASGKLTLSDGLLTGKASCQDGSSAQVHLRLNGEGNKRALVGTVGGVALSATYAEALPEPGASAKKPKKRSGEETFGRLMLAIAAVILAARLVGALTGRLRQPRVMGEVLAGVLLGPTLLGAVAPEVKDYLFPSDIVPLIGGASQIGLAFYLFLVGMEIDPRLLRERIGQAALISNTSVAFPMALGLLVALPVYKVLSPDVRYLPFALFMGIAMSITAFPVLARILTERRMLRRPVGAVTMACAAIDDVTAWGLLALATAVAASGSGWHALWVVALAAAFTAGMLLIVRPLLGRVSVAYDEVGNVPNLWIGIIFVGVLLSAYTAQQIGIAAIFGAFIMGLIMPRHAGLTDDVNRRLEDFVVTVLLPLFFVVTGLRTNVGSLNRLDLWLIALLLLAVAITGKWLGALAAAKYSGLSLRDSAAVGTLMNTRGLTELIVLNIGLDLGLISQALFTMLVIMALITTFMAGPALQLLDPRRELSEPPEEELRRAGPTKAAMKSILVACQDDKNLDALLTFAEPLAQSEPPRELILARLVAPRRFAAGLSSGDRELQRESVELNRRREVLAERDIAARAVAFTSSDVGADLVRLASEQEVDLLLMDGRRPLVGERVPRGPVMPVLEKAPCDVAVLVEREGGIPTIDGVHPVVVPFGGAEHDWAALELGAWLAYAKQAPLKLLGAVSQNGDGERDASRLLANASLVVQQLAGVAAEPALVEPGPALVEAAEGAGVLVVGLSDRWREEGLGLVRSEIAKEAPAPTIFVRRGRRAGALAPRDNMTRFRWSSAGPIPAR
jgi:Kef-type K+ transport system membrane component KefB